MTPPSPVRVATSAVVLNCVVPVRGSSGAILSCRALYVRVDSNRSGCASVRQQNLWYPALLPVVFCRVDFAYKRSYRSLIRNILLLNSYQLPTGEMGWQ